MRRQHTCSAWALLLRPWVRCSHLVLLYTCLADRAGPAVALHLKPAVEAGPAIKVAAQRDHRLGCELQGTGKRLIRGWRLQGGQGGHSNLKVAVFGRSRRSRCCS